jgi:hypothetical protein
MLDIPGLDRSFCHSLCFSQDRALARFVLSEKRVGTARGVKPFYMRHTTQTTRTEHEAHTNTADHLAKHHNQRGSTPHKETPTKKHPRQTLRHGGRQRAPPHGTSQDGLANNRQNRPPPWRPTMPMLVGASQCNRKGRRDVDPPISAMLDLSFDDHLQAEANQIDLRTPMGAPVMPKNTSRKSWGRGTTYNQ